MVDASVEAAGRPDAPPGRNHIWRLAHRKKRHRDQFDAADHRDSPAPRGFIEAMTSDWKPAFSILIRSTPRISRRSLIGVRPIACHPSVVAAYAREDVGVGGSVVNVLTAKNDSQSFRIGSFGIARSTSLASVNAPSCRSAGELHHAGIPCSRAHFARAAPRIAAQPVPAASQSPPSRPRLRASGRSRDRRPSFGRPPCILQIGEHLRSRSIPARDVLVE